MYNFRKRLTSIRPTIVDTRTSLIVDPTTIRVVIDEIRKAGTDNTFNVIYRFVATTSYITTYVWSNGTVTTSEPEIIGECGIDYAADPYVAQDGSNTDSYELDSFAQNYDNVRTLRSSNVSYNYDSITKTLSEITVTATCYCDCFDGHPISIHSDPVIFYNIDLS